MKQKLLRLLWLIAIPTIAFFVALAIDVHLDNAFEKSIYEWALSKGITISKEKVQFLSLANICSGVTDIPRSEVVSTCNYKENMQLIMNVAFLTGTIGPLALFVIALLGWLGRAHRLLLVIIFRTGLYGSLLLGVALLIAHGGLAIASIYYGESALTERIHIGLILTIGAVIVGGILKLLAPVLSTIKTIHHTVSGRIAPKEKYIQLWKLVEDSATRLQSLPPDNIVLGLGEEYFVTEAKITCLDGLLSGRTMFLSLPMMHLIDKKELTAVIGHELGHFRGSDTAYSRYFFPIYRGTQEALNNLLSEDSIIYLPCLAVLIHFMETFSKIESKFSRKRELLADQVASSLTSSDVVASALTKIYAYNGVWQEVKNFMIDALEKGKQTINSSQCYSIIIENIDRKKIVENLKNAHIEHPTDTHPPLVQRLEALHFDQEHFHNQLKIKPNEPAIHLIANYEELEKELTKIENVLLVKTGLALLPDK